MTQDNRLFEVVNLPNNILYKWEIGKEFVTIYDNINYVKDGYADIIDFLVTQCKVLIKKDNLYCIYEGAKGKRKRKYVSNLDLSTYQSGCEISISHQNECCFHPFTFKNTIFGIRRKPHIHILFKNNVINEDHINMILRWMADYLNTTPQALRQQYHAVYSSLPKEIPLYDVVEETTQRNEEINLQSR